MATLCILINLLIRYQGNFFVDEDTEKIYIIRNYVNSDGSEIFAAVSYQLLSIE